MSEIRIDTLQELLTLYNVEIPIIQRDYAQGRQDPHAKMVRSTLLADIKSAILGETRPLDLNFIYGKAETDKFIPLDGQQRLTTLFLLHLYAFRNDKTKTELLNKFTYKTRTSSRDFLEALIKNREAVFSSELIPTEEISDCQWFVSGWRYDPTVQSVLVMLDAIKETFYDVTDLDKYLTKDESKPITFKFLEMKNLSMEDSLYIKLNARGKPLTPFENFKARLIGQLQKINLPFIREFEQQFDCAWTDLFWSNYKGSFDQTYLLFFGVLFMNSGLCTTDENNWTISLDYDKIDSELFETAFYTLNFLCENPNSKNVHKMIMNVLTEHRTYPDRILFHAVTTYMHKTKGVAHDSLNDWLRIIKNLTLNSQIDSFATYQRAIDSINDVSDNWNGLLKYFSKNGKVGGFSREQIEEEQEKARIFLKDDDFANAIYSAEQHSYFSGQVRSAFYWQDSKSSSQENFTINWNKIDALFDDSKPKQENLLRRALLTYGDYTMPVGSYKTFCVNDPNEASSTPSMKRLFSNRGKEVKMLLDSINLHHDMEDQLNDIVNASSVPKNDWRYCFIAFPELFDLMSSSHLRLRDVEGEIIIIPNKSSSGYNYEVFLAALDIALGRENIEYEFEGEMGAYGERYLVIKDFTVWFDEQCFVIFDVDENEVHRTTTEDPIAEAVKYLK